MKKVLIIGGGFAGLAALTRLARAKRLISVTLIDSRKEQHFLPLLPDIVGRGLTAEHLAYNLESFSKRLNCQFIGQPVTAVDLEQNAVQLKDATINYDYLIIASGSQTNFYGQNQIAQSAYKLDSVEDAEKILRALEEDSYDNFVIAGGGYTGIEIATNLRQYFLKSKLNKRIVIVELAHSLLGPLPQWMKDYVGRNLKSLEIDVFLNTKVDKIEGKKIFLSNAEMLERAMLVWTAGVQTSDFLNKLNLVRSRQGRIKVDRYLKARSNCFVVGDAAEFPFGNSSLRMAVQFSLAEGQIAAGNILRQIRGRPLKSYRPVDLGYIIPMANNRSCGTILSINMKGYLPTLLHYLMCIYRTASWKNKLGIIRDLLLP